MRIAIIIKALHKWGIILIVLWNGHLARYIMFADIVCVNPRVNIYRKFKFFFLLLSIPTCSQLSVKSSLPLLYNTDATGHDIIDIFGQAGCPSH